MAKITSPGTQKSDVLQVGPAWSEFSLDSKSLTNSSPISTMLIFLLKFEISLKEFCLVLVFFRIKRDAPVLLTFLLPATSRTPVTNVRCCPSWGRSQRKSKKLRNRDPQRSWPLPQMSVFKTHRGPKHPAEKTWPAILDDHGLCFCTFLES